MRERERARSTRVLARYSKMYRATNREENPGQRSRSTSMDAAIFFFFAFNPESPISSYFARDFRFDADVALVVMKN